MKKIIISLVFISSLVLLFLFQNLTTNTISTSSQPPNILMILLDDAGQADYLNAKIAPKINELRQQATLFPYFYVTPMCTPTRMSYLSGRYPADHDIFWVCGSDALYGIPNTDATIPQSLAERGYTTGAFGKWHAGIDQADVGQGPDVYNDFDIKNKFEYWVRSPGVTQSGYFNPVMNINGVEKKFDNEHLEDVTGNLIKDYILKLSQQTVKKPFYIQYWLNAAHSKHEASLRMISDPLFKTQYQKCVIDPVSSTDRAFCIDWKVTNKRRLYELLLSQGDENIGKVLALFKTTDPYLQNTVIMLTSDNGGTGETRLTSPAYGNKDYLGRDLRSFKTDVFEGGIRQNLLLKMPGQTSSRIDSSFIANIDLFPTMIDLVKSQPTTKETNQFDGQSFYQRLLDPNVSFARAKPFFWSFKVQNEIDDVTEVRDEAGTLVEFYDKMSFAVRKGPWKLVYAPLLEHGCMPCLFDMQTGYSRESNGKDGSVSDDVAAKFPAVVEELREDYIEWLLSSTQLQVNVASKSTTAQVVSETIPGFKQGLTELVPNIQLPNVTGQDWVSLQNNHRFDVNRLDFTFSASITPQKFLGKTQVIAMRAGTWIFQVNAQRQLQLITFDRLGQPTTVGTSEQLSVSLSYDVSFVIYAFKGANTVVRIYARDRGGDLNNEERLVNLVRAETSKGLQANKETIYIGAKPGMGLSSFVGGIEAVRIYKAPLRRSEVGYGMRSWGNKFL